MLNNLATVVININRAFDTKLSQFLLDAIVKFSTEGRKERYFTTEEAFQI